MNNFENFNQKIDDLITRFFYKEEQLYFRIMVRINGGTLLPFNDYADYNEYKKDYAQLVEKKRANDGLQVTTNKAATTYMDFA